MINWKQRIVHCPQGVISVTWRDYLDESDKPYHKILFPRGACSGCQTRALCIQAKQAPRALRLSPQPQYEALHAARQCLKSDKGWRLYARRAGVEGILSQGRGAFGFRKTRYRGLEKTHLQNLAKAVAINIQRITAWLAQQH